jgi:rhodanese-related sulfurtransferase
MQRCLALLMLGALLAWGESAAASPTGPAEPAGPAGPDYVDPAQLLSLVSSQTEPYLLVDVRTPAEYGAGHIPTSLNLPVTEIPLHPPAADLDALIIVYCGSGVRSARAAAALKGMGYTRVVDFGAVTRWTGSLVDSAEPGKEPTP